MIKDDYSPLEDIKKIEQNIIKSEDILKKDKKFLSRKKKDKKFLSGKKKYAKGGIKKDGTKNRT